MKVARTRESRICVLTIVILNHKIQENRSSFGKNLQLKNSVHSFLSYTWWCRKKTGLANQVLVPTARQVSITDSAGKYGITAIATDTVKRTAGKRKAIKTFAHFAKIVVMTWIHVGHEGALIEQDEQDTRKWMWQSNKLKRKKLGVRNFSKRRMSSSGIVMVSRCQHSFNFIWMRRIHQQFYIESSWE